MIETGSSTVLAFVGTFAFFLIVYTIYRHGKRKQQGSEHPQPMERKLRSASSVEVPDGWDGKESLHMCKECGGFNMPQYLYCRYCINQLRVTYTVTPDRVKDIQKRARNE